jgi:hypothetical protein
MLYLLGEKGAASVDELVEMMPRFGWSVTADQMYEAGTFLKSLSLIQIKEAP